jgi:glucokinase
LLIYDFMTQTLLGLDLGGTKIAVAAIKTDIGNSGIIEKRIIPTPRDGHASVFAAMIQTGLEVIEAVGGVDGIGVGVPGPIDFKKGEVIFAPNIPGFVNAPVTAMLSEGFGRHVELENDANAAGLAEHVLGAARGSHSSIFLTISTGIGGGIVIHDRVWRGANGVAGEVGHIVALPGGVVAGSGVAGALEAVASGTALARDATYAFARPMDTRKLFALAQAGDWKALKIVDQAAFYLGVAIADMQKIIDPELFVLGGGVSEVGAFYLDKVQAAADESTKGFGKIIIKKAVLGSDAGVIGAALAARV